MATGQLRDPKELESGFIRWCVAEEPSRIGVPEVSLSHASGGLSNETVIAKVSWTDGQERFALRLAPLDASLAEYDLALQAELQEFLRSVGVRAAPARFVGDLSFLGVAFVVMPFIDGAIPGQVPAFDRWVLDSTIEQQRAIHDGLMDTLVRIHHIDWTSSDIARRLRGATTGLGEEVGWWQRYLGWAADGDPAPALVDAMSWCSAHVPADSPQSSLLWGDARLGNLIFNDDRQVIGVLDWELATIGPPEMDLGWYLALDAMMLALFNKSVPGFPTRKATILHYEKAFGRSVRDLAWHECFALTRAMAISDRQGRLAGNTETSVPLLDLLKKKIDEVDL